jgi:hypothetical protein
MQRRRFLLALTAAGAAVMLTACDDMPESAIAPWQGPPDDLRDARLRALSWALLAPNPHNLQPWIADLRTAKEVSLSLDPQRLLPATDPFGRQILIGCGGFLELLRMAAAQAGDAVSIELFPDGVPGDGPLTGTGRVARVRWTGTSAAADPLFAQVRSRRTNRAPYEERLPPADALARIAAAVQTADIRTEFAVAQGHVQALNQLAVEALRTEFATPAAWLESAKVTRLGAAEIAREPSGIPVHGPMIWWGRTLGIVSREDLADVKSSGVQRVVDRFVNAVAATPAWVWQSSADNSRLSQLSSGRAYLRLCLAATAEGLSMQPCSQALQEFPEVAAHFERIHALTEIAAPARLQMFTRLGYATAPGPAPRRPLDRMLIA